MERIKEIVKGSMPDPLSWRLEVCEGRQVWRFIENEAERIKRTVEYHLLTKKSNDANSTYENAEPLFESVDDSVRAAISFYSSIQTEDGHWAGDYGGPMFLLPGLIITCYISGTELPAAYKLEIIRYLINRQAEDGGWGLHIESPSTIFGTALNYCVLRILGVDRDDPRAVLARNFLLKNGGALGIPSWGKFWLCTLGVYKWEGMNPVPPELWWLPSWLPFHPSKMWCHCRVVYLPMAYVYGKRGTCRETDLLKELREELYTEAYDEIDFPKYREHCSPLDLYHPTSWIMRMANSILTVYEKIHSKSARAKAVACCLDHIKHEDETTKYIDIGPVNKVANMLAVWYAEGDSPDFRRHKERLLDYMWLSDDGMKMQGYNGSQLWDTAFAVQAICDSGLASEFESTMKKAFDYVDVTQVREDVDNMDKYYRHISKGAWPFSTRDHGWPISDCTAEGLKAAIKLHKLPFVDRPLADVRMQEAVNVMISMQNEGSGGWATYELTRGGEWMELINPSQVFGKIMVDYPYVECTSACMQALALFQKTQPDHRVKEIKRSINKGANFIRGIQRPDGSWRGSWAVCFTYGTWFGIWGLIAAGEEPESSTAIQKAVKFLLSKQMADGGWGESYMSCVTQEYVHNSRSQIINTAWALLGLMAGKCTDREAIDRGVRMLMRRQMPNGDFPQECISGVFNANCMITYTNYRNIFPIWALGWYRKRYGSLPSIAAASSSSQ